MKVLLIKPPSIGFKGAIKKLVPPLGLGYLASTIIKENLADVKILDATLNGYNNDIDLRKDLVRFGLSYQEISKTINDFHPDVVGIHLSLSIYETPALEVAKITKEIDERIVTVLGGVHSTVSSDKLIKNTNVDYIISGEGELSFIELLKNLNHKKKRGLVIPGKRIDDLNKLPMPAYHLMDMEKYFEINLPHNHFTKGNRVAGILTSRGCHELCIFCSAWRVFGRRFRIRTTINIKEEIDYLIENYGIDEVQFLDDNMTLNKKRTFQICDFMKSYNIPWCTPNGVSIKTISTDLLKAMKESGCYRITYAIESGNQKVNTGLLKKKIDLKKAMETILETKKIMEVHCFFMIGIPGETLEDMQDTFNFIKEASPDSMSMSIAVPLLGTELFDLCSKNNYLSTDFTTDLSFERVGNINTDDFTGKQLEKLLGEKNQELNKYLASKNHRAHKKYDSFALKHKNIDKKTLFDKI